MKEEKIRLKGHMRTHKALIKSIIRTRKFEISCISAPQPVKGREDGYCYMYIDGYPTEGSVEADVYISLIIHITRKMQRKKITMMRIQHHIFQLTQKVHLLQVQQEL